MKAKLPADVIGFTSTTLDYPMVMDLKNELKNKLKINSKFIIGGAHASATYNDIINDGWDVIFKGEGELSILKFIDN
ncbi:MAG: cobalamin-dependent protein, partial [Bacteroidetes bacterium]|nr:cobalamin-dependent protein [Bacteroidota bacterium]